MGEKTLTLKNYQLIKLAKFLDIPLSGSLSRSRNRFMKLVRPRIREYDDAREEELKLIADRDEAGKVILIPDQRSATGKAYRVAPEKLEDFDKWHKELLEEELTIVVNASNEKDVETAKKLLFETEREFNVEDGRIYDEICEAFERTSA